MIYYCTDCQFAKEIDDNEVATNKIKLPEICPNCHSVNVILSKEGGVNWKTICWWIFGATALGALPFEMIAESIGEGNSGYDFFMFMALAGFVIVGLSPKFIKKKINETRYAEVRNALNSNDYKTAEQKLTDILSLNAYDTKAYFERGKIRYKNKQIELAKDDFVNTTLLEPSNMEYAYYRATIFMSYMDDEAYNVAIESFSALILNGYVKDECFNSRGECYLATCQYEKALADFEKALKLNPNNETYKNNRKSALSKISTGDFIPTSIQEPVMETMYENNTLEEDIKIDLATCTKEELMKLKVFDESKADDFISTRQTGKLYYDIESLTQDFNLQPHEIVQIQDKLIFPLKPQAKKGRAIDF